MRLPKDRLDEYDRLNIVTSFVKLLLVSFDVVVFGDTDELIVADPDRYSGLAEFCAQSSDVTRPVGLNVFQHTAMEPRLIANRPVLGQRRFCQFKAEFCKPVIVKREVGWIPGFHFCNAESQQARDVYLFHLKSVDLDYSLSRLAHTRAMAWSDLNVQVGLTSHHRATDQAHVEEFFDKPRAQFDAASSREFDFTFDIDRIEQHAGVKDGLYMFPWFTGHIAEIPKRFHGVF